MSRECVTRERARAFVRDPDDTRGGFEIARRRFRRLLLAVFSRVNNQAGAITPGRLSLPQTRRFTGVCDLATGTLRTALEGRVSRPSGNGGGDPTREPPGNTERKERVESICHGAGQCIDANPARTAPARSTLIFHGPVNGDKVSPRDGSWVER